MEMISFLSRLGNPLQTRNFEALERIDQLDGENACLLREILRASPIPIFTRIPRLSKETANLFGQVGLRGVQLLSRSLMQIVFCDRNILASFALIGGCIGGRELWRDLRDGMHRRVVSFSVRGLRGGLSWRWRFVRLN